MSHNKMVDVSVILVNYNTCKMTSECVDSIIEHTSGVTYEIILVDNASTDGSKEFFEKDPRVSYYYSDVNGGFGFGNNLGMSHSYGRYLFLLNTDTLLINNAIKEFFDYAESHEPNTVYGCWLVDNKGDYACSYFNFPAMTFKQFRERNVKGLDTTEVDYKEKYVECITGADMFIPRTAIETVGGFDTNIFMQGEETELQMRMLKAGFKSKLIPQPKIVHFGGASGFTTKRKVGGIISFFVFYKLHLPVWKYIIARIYYGVAISMSLIGRINQKWARESLKGTLSVIRLRPDANKVSLPDINN